MKRCKIIIGTLHIITSAHLYDTFPQYYINITTLFAILYIQGAPPPLWGGVKQDGGPSLNKCPVF
jgi:hypothetical protein